MTEHRREYNRTYLREWRKNNREKMRSYDLKWRTNNPEAAKSSDKKKYRKYYDNHPELKSKAVIRTKAWILANPDRWKLNLIKVEGRRRARKRGTQIGPIDFELSLIQSNGICGICGMRLASGKIEFDHIIPLARGGLHTQDNIQPTHASCNRKKGTKLMVELDIQNLG